MNELLELPFDQYQRYRLVADLLQRLRPEGGRLVVLDVGGRTALLRSFLPDDRVELVDVDPSDERGLVLGDGARLPFADACVDVVCAFDTLEHVPPALREAFVDECARVARRHAILAGPYRAPQVDEAEEILQQFLRDKLGAEHRYLAEHRHNGLPDRDATEARFRAAGARVASVGHANLERWLPMMCMELYMDHDPLLRGVARRLFRFYNEALYASDHAEPVYRHAVVAAFGDAPLPDLEGLFAPPTAPPGSLATIAELGYQLVRFDTEQEAWRPELARLEGVVRGLEADLAGHRSRLSDTQADLLEHQRTVAALQEEQAADRLRSEEQRQALEQDLQQHDATIAELRAALEAERSERANLEQLRERERADAEAVRNALEQDLAGNRASVAALTEERDRIEADLRGSLSRIADLSGELHGARAGAEAQGARAAELERILGETRAAAAEIEAALRQAQAGLEQQRAEIAARDARIGALVGRLRSRWDSLKRAFSPRKGEF